MQHYLFEAVDPLKLKTLRFGEKDHAIKWLEEVIESYPKEEEEITLIRLFQDCIEGGHKIPKELKDDFAALVRDEIVNWAGGITRDTHPISAINQIEDAKFYTKIYEIYAL